MAVTDYVGIGVPPSGQARQLRLRIDDYVSVAGLPPEAQVVDLWYPLLSDDPNQRVLDVSIDLDQPLDLGHDPEHGNRMVHLRLPRPLPPRLGFRVSFLVSRSSQPGHLPRTLAGQAPGHPL